MDGAPGFWARPDREMGLTSLIWKVRESGWCAEDHKSPFQLQTLSNSMRLPPTHSPCCWQELSFNEKRISLWNIEYN